MLPRIVAHAPSEGHGIAGWAPLGLVVVMGALLALGAAWALRTRLGQSGLGRLAIVACAVALGLVVLLAVDSVVTL